MTENKHSTSTDWIDPDDAPPLTDDFFDRADEYHGDRLIRRGRPKSETTKTRITIRLSADVLDAFRSTGKGWQTRMDAALRDWLKGEVRG